METNDHVLSQILSDIHYCDEGKRKTQREIDYYLKEINTLNLEIENARRRLDKPMRELEYYQNEMTILDRKFSTLHQSEKRRRDEIAREQQSRR